MQTTIERLVSLDIPVMGHVGLTPQSYHRMGGHRLQGISAGKREQQAGSAERVMADAIAVAEAGAFALVLEGIPEHLAAEITRAIPIPTIGIMAGSQCDGQVRVIYDLVGLTQSGAPASIKSETNLAGLITEAVGDFTSRVQSSGSSVVIS
jgi:3-methyl-2-oxobutanoate hydroxymethyltransferase